MSKFDFFDDVIRCSPYWYPFLGFNAKFTTAFESHTALVDFNFVGKWSFLFIRSKVWMMCNGFARCSELSPCCPFLSVPSFMLPCPILEELIQRCIRGPELQETDWNVGGAILVASSPAQPILRRAQECREEEVESTQWTPFLRLEFHECIGQEQLHLQCRQSPQ